MEILDETLETSYRPVLSIPRTTRDCIEGEVQRGTEIEYLELESGHGKFILRCGGDGQH